MIENQGDCCATCRFWVVLGRGWVDGFHKGEGTCHYSSPSPYWEEFGWPGIDHDEWCGKHDGYQPSVNDDVVFTTTIHNLALSLRSRNALSRNGFRNVLDLVNSTEYDLLDCKDFGKVCLREVTACLADHGLRIGGGINGIDTAGS